MDEDHQNRPPTRSERNASLYKPLFDPLVKAVLSDAGAAPTISMKAWYYRILGELVNLEQALCGDQ